MFVGNNKGTLWHFDLDRDRAALSVNGPLQDKIADTNSADELDQVTFGDKFGGIVDMQVGPYDGLLYILCLDGTIYKIVPQ